MAFFKCKLRLFTKFKYRAMSVNNFVRLACVDGAALLWAHHFWIDIVGIRATASSITVSVM